MTRIAAVLAVLLAIGSAGAQEQPASPPAARRPERDEVFKIVDAYIMSNLQEGLGLTDDEFVRLLPLVKRLQSDRRELARRRHRSLQELRRVLRAGGATQSRVAELLSTLKTDEQEELATLRRDRDAIDAALTPLQQAKFRVLEVEVEQKLRDLMGKAREERLHERSRRRQRDPPP